MNIEYTADDLINAIETGNTQVVDLFEKSGFDLRLAGKNHKTPLMAAAHTGNQQIDPYSPSQSNSEDDTVITYQINTPKGAVIVSNDNIVLHLGQSVHIMPSQDSLDPGQVRWMGSANDNMDVVSMKAAGKKHPHGSTEAIFTGKKLGTTHWKLVPDYGDWNRAAVLTFTVIE